VGVRARAVAQAEAAMKLTLHCSLAACRARSLTLARVAMKELLRAR
jgi:hypothetical protein